MAVIYVDFSQASDFNHCMDVFEFVGAAGNVNHQIILTIRDEALQYLDASYQCGATGKSTRKILSSLPLYDVEDIYIDDEYKDIPNWAKPLSTLPDVAYDYKVQM